VNTKQERQTQTAIRLPDSLLERIDKIAERMSKSTGIRTTRSDVHRLAVEQGVNKLEQGEKLMRRMKR
jgi:predicted DNA-binding protein